LVRQLIWNFKYQYVEALALPLSQLLADYFRNTLGAAEQETPWIASSIPLHPRRLRWRGFNQAELLAKRFAENLNLPYLNTLERIRYQKPQVEITSRKKRFENIADSFRLAANTSVRNRNIILVDDVVTSGATLEAAAKTLRQAGAKHVWGMVIAKG
jgi:ComF family protein